jgi:hypothetical protein
MEVQSPLGHFVIRNKRPLTKEIKMRKVMLATIVFAGMSAQASWYQESCSNGEGTVKLAHGHNDNFISYTTRVYDGNGGVEENIVRDESGDLRFEIVEEKELAKESHQSCDGTNQIGFGTWKNVTYRRVKITKADGSAFNENTLELSQDKQSIVTSMICEENGNSEILCEKK